jgi:hypothetical protein
MKTAQTTEQGTDWRLPALTGLRRKHPYRIYIHTPATRSSYGQAGWSWCECGTVTKVTQPLEGYSDKDLQLLAIASAIERVPNGATVEIYTSSRWALKTFFGHHRRSEPSLRSLPRRTLSIIRERGLEVWVRWIPLRENVATGLLSLQGPISVRTR